MDSKRLEPIGNHSGVTIDNCDTAVDIKTSDMYAKAGRCFCCEEYIWLPLFSTRGIRARHPATFPEQKTKSDKICIHCNSRILWWNRVGKPKLVE